MAVSLHGFKALEIQDKRNVDNFQGSEWSFLKVMGPLLVDILLIGCQVERRRDLWIVDQSDVVPCYWAGFTSCRGSNNRKQPKGGFTWPVSRNAVTIYRLVKH